MIADINLATLQSASFNVIGEVNVIDEYIGYINGTPFQGVFDGNGFSVYNLVIQEPVQDAIGLFSYVDDINAFILNVTLVDPNILGQGYVGALVGVLGSGSVSNCHVENGKVRGTDSKIGGLVARSQGGNFSDCSYIGIVSGLGTVGGLVGGQFGYQGQVRNLSNCRAEGTVLGTGQLIGGLIGRSTANMYRCVSTADVNGWGKVGGLVGDYYLGTIEESHATGDVFCQSDRAGGLIGMCEDSHIERCFATGNVLGNTYSGGLIGQVYDDISTYSSLTDCYATGDVNGNTSWRIGGLIGDCEADVWNCYATGRVRGGSNYVGGLIGVGWTTIDSFWDIETSGQSSSDSGEGLTTAEMQKRCTFTNAGWDFIEIWDIGESQTYPYLRVYPAGDLNHDGVVNLPDFAIFADHWLAGVE